MGYAVRIYEAFRDLGEDRAKLLAEVIESLETEKAATPEDLKETEDRLTTRQLELLEKIESLREEVKKTELKVEQTRKEMKEIELKLTKEIEQVKVDLTEVISKGKTEMIKWSVGLFATQTAMLMGAIYFMVRSIGGV